MPERLDGGRMLIALGALALLVSLFTDWYGPGGGLGDGVSAWTALELIDLLLAALALLALYAVATAALPRAGIAAAPHAALRIAGPLALVLVLSALVDDPPAVRGASAETGLWVAVAASALMALGALLSVARISLVIRVRDRAAGAARPSGPVEPRDEVDDEPPIRPDAPTRPLPPDSR